MAVPWMALAHDVLAMAPRTIAAKYRLIVALLPLNQVNAKKKGNEQGGPREG
jgi:hypothetical protein